MTRLRILVVEDQDEVGELLVDALTDFGHSVKRVGTLRDARAALEQTWDVVLTDIRLPDGSGLDIGKYAHTTPTTFIALTGLGSAADVSAVRQAGFHHHLVKPVSIERLRAILSPPPHDSRFQHMTRIRVFVVDDHPLVREGVKRVVEADPELEVVGEAATGEEATEQVGMRKPDVVIVDISMPGIGGAQTTQLLKQLNPHVKMIALSVHEDRNFMRDLFEAGASGYVVKRAPLSELVHAIRTVMANGVYVDPRLAGNLVSNLVQGDGLIASRTHKLTERESNVLRRVAEGYSNKEIAAELNLSIKTVETYKTRAMEKLGLRDRVEIVRFAVKQGWLRG